MNIKNSFLVTLKVFASCAAMVISFVLATSLGNPQAAAQNETEHEAREPVEQISELPEVPDKPPIEPLLPEFNNNDISCYN